MKRQLLSGIFAGVIATSSVSAENLPKGGMQNDIRFFVDTTVLEVGPRPGEPVPPKSSSVLDWILNDIGTRPGQPVPPKFNGECSE